MKVELQNNICVSGKKTDCNFKILENFIPPYDATIVEKLKQNTNNVKITTRIKNENNGLISFRPTLGMVSRYGIILLAPSLEQVTIEGDNIEEIKNVFNTIKGYDEKDSTSYVKDKNVGVAYHAIQEKIENIKLENEYINETLYVIECAELSSNTGKFDGIRYGYRADKYTNLEELYKNTRKEGFDIETKKKMILGTYFLDSKKQDKYYRKANIARTKIKKEFNEIFKNIDFLTTPLEEKYLKIPSLTGRPSIIINDIQIIGDHFSDNSLIEFAKEMGGAK